MVVHKMSSSLCESGRRLNQHPITPLEARAIQAEKVCSEHVNHSVHIGRCLTVVGDVPWLANDLILIIAIRFHGTARR